MATLEKKPLEKIGLQFPSDPRYLRTIRTLVYDLARQNGFSKHAAFDWKIIVGEAVSNVIRFAYDGKKNGVILIEVLPYDSFLEVQIRDFGRKNELGNGQAMDLSDFREGGLGLYLIGKLSDFHFFDRSLEKGTRLILKKRIE